MTRRPACATTTPPSGRWRGFSLVEMLLALAISATLLTAALAALDSSFKGYKATTESASTH
ncbi:MAG: prepilin-type N-terminal cleavage/methylation domain-containing protein, partial [Planctomycetota bacterium]